MDDSPPDFVMNILALETSQPHASLCLSRDGETVFSASWEAERNHDAYLFPALQKALAYPEAAELHTLLVGAGPGSYGGVRVALAAAVGVATVRGGRVVAFGSWEPFAAPGLSIISDARRNGWTVRRPDGCIEVISAEEARALPAPVVSVESPEVLAAAGITVQQAGIIPTAEALVRTWLALSAEQRETLAAKPAEPIYVRPPHIVPAKRKPWEIRHG